MGAGGRRCCRVCGQRMHTIRGRAGFFRRGILSVLIKPEAPKLQYFMKGCMACSTAPEIS